MIKVLDRLSVHTYMLAGCILTSYALAIEPTPQCASFAFRQLHCTQLPRCRPLLRAEVYDALRD